MCWGLKGEALLPPLGNNIRRRKDARNEMRADVLDYVGFGTMQLRFTIFTKLFHSVQFLTIRQSQRRIRSSLYKTLVGAKLGVFFCFFAKIICFANFFLCKGAKAPLQPCGTVQFFVWRTSNQTFVWTSPL